MEHTRRQFVKRGALATTIGASGLAGCSGSSGDSNDTTADASGEGTATSGSSSASGVDVKIGSKRFSTQELYSHLSMKALQEKTEANVVDETGLGGTSQIWRAIQNDSIDHYYTYTLNIWQTFSGHDTVISDPQEIYDKCVDVVDEEYKNLQLLQPSEARADWTVVVRPDWAKENDIASISDFAEYVKSGNTDFTFVSYAEFAERSDGIPSLLETYDIPEDKWNEVNLKKVGYGPLNYQILNSEQAVATSGWLTQPQIYKYGFDVLEDDKGFTSANLVTPVVRKEILEGNDVIEETINEVSATLTTEEVRAMVLRISNTDASVAEVAEGHLKKNDII
ncbi:glycine betaine ABC transporter substrate-binding protein [Haloarculaceae archaeon H-GB11]|nr:glycine betaine ABC transporter substrate-binding protein [Haloarculaceae archaeon H-GB11]